MLQAASDLIAESGSDGMRMSEVAERARVPIGSLYQFFPDKASIIRTLAERCNEGSRECIEEGLAGVSDMDGLRRAFASLFEEYYAIFLAEPVMRDIWTAMQADKSLSALELAESRRNGALLADVLLRLNPSADPGKVGASAFLIMHLGEATMRMAVSLSPEEGRAIVEAYKAMADHELAAVPNTPA